VVVRQKRKRRKVRSVQVDPDDEPLVLSRRTWVLLVVGAVLLAIPGVVIYAVSPGVGTYQANGLLILPLLVLLGYGLHKWLPVRLQWVLAVILAPLGSVAYLLVPSAQWWNYGPLTAVPLVALAAWKYERRRTEVGDPEPWYGGMTDGPWGPP
jgi:peptidoglycan/LPS O-acetylase OafA/YrhL